MNGRRGECVRLAGRSDSCSEIHCRLSTGSWQSRIWPFCEMVLTYSCQKGVGYGGVVGSKIEVGHGSRRHQGSRGESGGEEYSRESG